jgi:UDP:flavonoid glycosyltransferase YjiC (YdhE family)
MPDIQTQQAADPPSQEGEAALRIVTETQDGHPVSVVRDPAGQIVYPTFVPPEVESPEGTAPLSQATTSPPQASQPPKKSSSDPAKLETAEKRPRPSMDKKFMTELRRPTRAHSNYAPILKRAGTNVSQLQQAIWQPYDHDDTSSSSSSSSSEDEGDEGDEYDNRAEEASVQTDGDTASKKKPRPRARASDQFRRFRVGNENYRTKGKVSKRDGRLKISVKDTSNTGYLAKALGAAVRKVVPLKDDSEAEELEGGQRPSASRMSSTTLEAQPCPRLNIVIMVIGSRGDAQPFLKVGKILKEQYGHRVRIATHPAFREFVEKDSGLEFFSVGGDPSELMAFMVKNPGMIPTIESVKAGDIGRRRAAMAEMFEGFWRACINATDDEKDTRNLKMMGEKDPFVADAIIANPPSFAHIHCAEALGIPLHLMFTFPYTPTQSFPHPLASIKKSNVDPGYTNFISYPLVEMMVWQGLGDLVNDFRQKTLGLDPVSTLWAPGASYRLHVPFTYMWSPGLVPKPRDWGAEIDVSGFVFLDLASSFKPPSDLEKFLSAGEQPVYIGFGSIVVDDPNHFTEMIFEAVKLAGVRALVSKGWGGLGGDNVPDNIFMLENTPHDWLFPRVKACVIHGGAGTTAIALKCGKPTMVVPFFGDQHFWGSMLEKAKAGPEPVPYKHLSAEKLAEGIKYCLTDEARDAAAEMAKDIELEGDGAENACKSFHSHLTLHGKHSMRCSVLEDRVAVWQLKDTHVKLSALAADIIVDKGHVPWKKLRLIRHNEWNDFEGPGEPVTGFAGSLVSTVSDVVGGVAGVPLRLAKSSAARRERKERKKERRAARAKAKQEKTAANATLNGSVQPSSETQTDKNKSERENAIKAAKKPEAKDFAQKDNEPPAQNKGARPDQTADDGDETASVDTAGTDGTEVEGAAETYATDVRKGVGKSMRGIARAPVDLSLAVAQGFHNAPRLYGDDTVRRPPRVTGVHSGLRAARYEFVYGIYDGWTGLVRLPVRGARNGGGVKGATKGVGMGAMGWVLKNISAVAGPVGYTLKGLAKQVERGRMPVKYIRRARIMQGQREERMLSDEERKAKVEEAVAGWEVMKNLWDAVAERERRTGVIKRRVDVGRRTKRGLGAAFESVEIAEKALEAVRRGDSFESVVDRLGKSEQASALSRGRKSEDGGRRSTDSARRSSRDGKKRSSLEKGADPDNPKGGKKKSTVTEPIAEEEEAVDKGVGDASREKEKQLAASGDAPGDKASSGKTTQKPTPVVANGRA